MNGSSEKRVTVNEICQLDTSAEEVDESLGKYFEELEDQMYGVEAIETGDQEYVFEAVGSQVDVLYELEEQDDETELDIEFTGSEPLVERLYGDFEENLHLGVFSSL